MPEEPVQEEIAAEEPSVEKVIGISEERLEEIISKVVQDVVERVARETMASVAEESDRSSHRSFESEPGKLFRGILRRIVFKILQVLCLKKGLRVEQTLFYFIEESELMQKETMPKGYEPKEVEEKWYKYWEDHRLFRAEAKSDRKPFCIVIPPPNVTGSLHMGHALNNTLQDILCRFKKMQGYNVLWQPGTDHAGIATQNVVERELAAKGTDRHQVGREKFIELVWEWKEKYGGVIINQLKRLGSSCDWSRERFTMDEGLSRAVREVFVRLYEENLIYRGDYIINWCPRCRTALADLEVEHEEMDSSLYYIRYRVQGPPGPPDGGNDQAGDPSGRYGRRRESRG